MNSVVRDQNTGLNWHRDADVLPLPPRAHVIIDPLRKSTNIDGTAMLELIPFKKVKVDWKLSNPARPRVS
jgi:hypothetical protein